ncbi:MAG: heparinase II/III family protein [candidate division KSB1 bacterium]|nr:heparinase II/III family protein [candidate division KSB1 bacterium]
MTTVKNGSLLFLLFFIIISANHTFATAMETIKLSIDKAPDHPRLFFHENERAALEQKLLRDSLLTPVYDSLLNSAEKILDTNPVRYQLTGRRLLGQSRTCLNRVTRLAFAYRMTGKKRYLKRAQQEMLAAAAFKDWNPLHFLDVAEMTAALAVGYDWLYHDLNPDSRARIRQAVIDKGLVPGLGDRWWVKTSNNWNQVCHGGLVLGALAILEHAPELSSRIIERAVENVPIAMREYAPDGAYPEGPGYWEYGTSFNVLLIDALRTALGTDFNLSDAEGFEKTGYYYHASTGPTGLYFNYSDCGLKGDAAAPLFWFAQELNDHSLLYQEIDKLSKLSDQDRMLPFLLIWSPRLNNIPIPKHLHWMANGNTPVTVHRSDWSEEGVYVGVKGGSPGANHAHMDIGSFVIDALGERWASDLGSQNYHSLESLGIDLWNKSQDSERWQIFRLNSKSHNTLTVNDKLQQVNGFAEIAAFSSEPPMPHTILDLSSVYNDQLTRVRRGIGLWNNRIVVIQDEMTALEDSTRVRWSMLTRATVTTKGSEAQLEQNGRSVRLKIIQPAEAEFIVYPSDPPPADYDARNPDTRILGFESEINSRTPSRFLVLMMLRREPVPDIQPLSAW